MTAAATLQEAAGLAYDNIAILQAATTLKADLTLFWQQANAPGIFEEQAPNDHPIANWLAIIAALASNMLTTPTLEDVDFAAQYVYRICLVARSLKDMNLITTGQAAALLLAYNDNLA